MLVNAGPMKRLHQLSRQHWDNRRQSSGVRRTQNRFFYVGQIDSDHGGVLGIGICLLSWDRPAVPWLGDAPGYGHPDHRRKSSSAAGHVYFRYSAMTLAQFDRYSRCGALSGARQTSSNALFGSQVVQRLRFPDAANQRRRSSCFLLDGPGDLPGIA